MPADEVLGIDVAARRGCDVVALGADLVARPLGVVHGAAELRELLAHRPAPPRVVAIDAPRAWAVDGRRRAGECALRARGFNLYTTPDASRADHPFYAWMRTGFDLYRAVDPGTAFEVYPYATAVALDISVRAKDPKTRALAAARGALLTPIAKAFSTDIGNEVSSLGVQIHGGMGFIEETGAAQHYRDARITPIYEGTNGIQSIDLVTRKLAANGGAALTDVQRNDFGHGGMNWCVAEKSA